jgi:hypothetical protein
MATVPGAADPGAGVAGRIFHAAWMSILLGLLIEIALLVTAVGFGKAERLSPFIADLAGMMSWSVLVCVGLAIGSAAAGLRGPVMGLLGLLSAPAGFALAKAAHKSAAQALDVAIAAAAPPPAFALVSRGVNEVLFALGCSIVLYAVSALGRRVRLAVAV